MTNKKDPSIQFKADEDIDQNDRILFNKKKGFDGFLSASDVLENKKIEKFSTGSSQLDKILGGGIETGSITQIYGDPGSGKSQICLTACALIPQEYKSIYIDTEGKFRPERLKQIIEARNLEASKVLRNTIIAKPLNSQEMERSFDQIPTFFDSNKPFKLLVVDSIINHLKVEYQGRSQLPLRQQRLSLLMSKLQNIATEKDVSIVITNHVQTEPNFLFSYDNNVPTGGNIINFSSSHIVGLKKNRTNTHASLIKSNYLPCNDSNFIITEKGIEDFDKELNSHSKKYY